MPAGSTVTTLTTIESADYNAVLADLEADANVDRPIAAGGTGASTAAGARANLGVRALKAIDTAGSSNAYTYTSTDSLTPSDGDAIIIIANFSNTGAATIDVDSTGAVAIKKMVSGTATALASGDIQSGHHYLLTYDSGETAWLVQGFFDITAADVPIVDSGAKITATDVEGALQETAQQTQGQHTIWVPAAAMIARTTNGAAYQEEELATNDVMLIGWNFDKDTDEAVQFSVQMPKSWDEGTVVAQVVWTTADTAGTGNVVWGVQGVAISDDDALDVAMGTAQVVTDGFLADKDAHVTSETSAITIGGTPAAEDLVVFQVYRDADNGSDTYTQDAKLVGVKIHYTTDADTDD